MQAQINLRCLLCSPGGRDGATTPNTRNCLVFGCLATSKGSGSASSAASATGGGGGASWIGTPGEGGDGVANSTAMARGSGGASSSAVAIGGAGGFDEYPGPGGDGGDATATANASAAGGGTAIAKAVATGGAAERESSGSYGRRECDVERRDRKRRVGSSAIDRGRIERTGAVDREDQSCRRQGPVGGRRAGRQHRDDERHRAGRGSGQAFVNPGETAYAFSTALPDKAYSATLIDGAHNVAGALLGPRDVVFGTAILGANYAADGGGESHTYSATSTFDFGYGGDLKLGLIGSQEDGFAGGLGFQSLEFTITANGVEILDTTFRSLSIAESFFHDSVFDLGSSLGPDIDLTFGYTLVADGSGGFGFDLAVGRRGSRDLDLGDDAPRLRRPRLCGLSQSRERRTSVYDEGSQRHGRSDARRQILLREEIPHPKRLNSIARLVRTPTPCSIMRSVRFWPSSRMTRWDRCLTKSRACGLNVDVVTKTPFAAPSPTKLPTKA